VLGLKTQTFFVKKIPYKTTTYAKIVKKFPQNARVTQHGESNWGVAQTAQNSRSLGEQVGSVFVAQFGERMGSVFVA